MIGGDESQTMHAGYCVGVEQVIRHGLQGRAREFERCLLAAGQVHLTPNGMSPRVAGAHSPSRAQDVSGIAGAAVNNRQSQGLPPTSRLEVIAQRLLVLQRKVRWHHYNRQMRFCFRKLNKTSGFTGFEKLSARYKDTVEGEPFGNQSDNSGDARTLHFGRLCSTLR